MILAVSNIVAAVVLLLLTRSLHKYENEHYKDRSRNETGSSREVESGKETSNSQAVIILNFERSVLFQDVIISCGNYTRSTGSASIPPFLASAA